ncbi:CmcI family methyltransferase [Haliea sp. E17]|uniref:CmcI family methyltransferase n=1 Tax=Haliea sp. E17 TaxID=3401576 RepID=UPI003AB04360
MGDGTLHRYFLNNGDKRIHKWLHFFDIYERHFERFRGKSPVIVEIGVKWGGSLQMWKDYFGPGCKVVGIDINPDCARHAEDAIEILIGSQDDPAVIEQVFERYPQVDIVIDDGSHIMEHMIATFEMMYHRVQPNGVYLVEDTHTCYWEVFGGGLRREGTFMEFTKHKLDELNAVHTREALPVTEFTRSTDYIACYDSVVVFERRPQGRRRALVTHGM